MKVKVLEKTDKTIEIELDGEGHTFCNLLRKYLIDDERVTFAGYRIDHPLIGKTKIYVRTDGTIDPIDALLSATERIKKDAETLLMLFKREVGE
ncbi:MAG: DNA-directed RNA polymerase subunit L [Candidatus Baldrarchaeia archaeon]